MALHDTLHDTVPTMPMARLPRLDRPEQADDPRARRAGYPGPAAHDPTADITATLMRMVDDAVLSPDAAQLVAWARGLNPAHNGAFYTPTCAPRVLWHGMHFDAALFNHFYSEECAHADTLVDGLPLTNGLGARHRPVAWLWVDETLEWDDAPRATFLRPSQRVLDVLTICLVVVCVPLVALMLWEIGAALATLWPWLAGPVGW